MKLSKRIFAVILAIILAMSVFAVSASAVTGSMNFQVKAASNTYAAGSEITVNIFISDNYNATCLRFPVLYSSDVFELPSNGNIRLTAYNDCLAYKGSLDANTSNDGSYIPAEYNSSDYGAVLIQWTASVSSTKVGCFRSESSTQCFSFKLQVKSSAGGKTGSIFIPSESGLFYNQTVIDVTDATTISRIDTSLSFNDLNVVIDQGDADGITTHDGSDVIIDYENKLIYNWELGTTKAIIENNVKPLGNATLRYVPSDGESGAWGTGAKVRVWGSNGSLIDDYYILIFGDVNGDASVDVSDLTIATRVNSGYNSLTGLFYTAADLDDSGDFDISDSTAFARAISGSYAIPQSK